ncbi:hypothetical protein [Enterococcus mediterraneensis]|uniref:hypothetical protein n=1 Tax=Enterococcus mediterraneensis TaxID=2364791 RepID=UPI000F063132|nr:hypothetical protein [Enterococcus mediterraneensis]
MKKLMLLSLLVLGILGGCASENKKAESSSSSAFSESSASTQQVEKIDFTTYNTGIDFEEFVRDPEGSQDKKTILAAKVIQVMEADDLVQYLGTIQTSPDKSFTVALVISKEKITNKVIEGDEIRVWVRGLGVYEYTNTLGVEKTIPRFLIDGYDIV